MYTYLIITLINHFVYVDNITSYQLLIYLVDGLESLYHKLMVNLEIDKLF